ncbi:uncharacterized protein LOC123298308 [Chrysoperla carnea]|uniref:uncharacterized protein LOC123298308 n=1 Tax=Chrysoperla carnea TaxID=189513 RepID=UPI001D083555|nr:uncharacterized protein LOC123298308 [Chrysoperla carnea]
MKYNQKNLDDSDIIPILREIFPRSTTQKIETTTKSFGSNDDTTFVYSNQTDVFDYETYEEVSTNKSVQTTEYSIKDEKPIKYNNLTDVIMKIYNDDEVIKDLERNNDLLRRVHDAIVKDSMNNNQTLLINQSNTQTIYHTVMITLLGIAIGIFLAIIIASIILYMTDTSRKVAKHTRARLQNTVMNKKDYVPNSVHYIQRDEFMTPLQERITIFNPKFTAEPESTFGNLLTTDCRDKVNRFITDTLRVVYDNTYDHPQSPPTNGQFVGSTFFASKSDQSAEHLYDEIPAWKQPKPIAQAQLPQYSETCEYVTKSDGPDIITTKL